MLIHYIILSDLLDLSPWQAAGAEGMEVICSIVPYKLTMAVYEPLRLQPPEIVSWAHKDSTSSPHSSLPLSC